MRRGLLLDRDGVVNIDHGFVSSRDKFEFTPGLFPFLREAENRGFRLAIITNQSGIARGMYSQQDFDNLTAWMLGELRREGIKIDLVLSCPDHPEGSVPAYTRQSFWRKPNAGMVLDAVQRLRLDPSRSALVGDKLDDMLAAKAGGIGHCFLFQSKAEATNGMVTVKSFEEILGAFIK